MSADRSRLDLFDARIALPGGWSVKPISSEAVLQGSSGEVTSADTMDAGGRPSVGGLYCERIFGAVGDRERDERTGHFRLASPCLHIGMMPLVYAATGIPDATTYAVLREERWLVTSSSHADVRVGADLSEGEQYDLTQKRGADSFAAETGAAAVRTLLATIDPDDRALAYDAAASKTEDEGKRALLARLSATLRRAKQLGVRPVDAIVEYLPIAPPTFRPTDYHRRSICGLYQHVVMTDRRLGRFMSMRAPEVLQRTERRRLQELVTDVLSAAVGKMLAHANLLPEPEDASKRSQRVVDLASLDSKVTYRTGLDSDEPSDENANAREVDEVKTWQLRWIGALGLIGDALQGWSGSPPDALRVILRSALFDLVPP